MTAKLRSLRRRVWPREQQDIGEALRDLHGFCEQLTLCGKVPISNAVWSEPFSFALEQRPDIVLLADARVAGTLESVEVTGIKWTLDVPTTGRGFRVRVDRAAGLQSGKSYDLKFLVVY